MALKYKLATRSQQPLLSAVLDAHGWEQTTGDECDLIWFGRQFDLATRPALPRFANHFADVRRLTDKADMHRRLVEFQRAVESAGVDVPLSFVPLTFEMPFERRKFQKAAAARPGLWIAKRSSGWGARGTYLFESPDRAPAERGWVVQQYIKNPHLLMGHNYTLRLFLVQTSLDPLVVHIHREGMVKRTSVPFTLGAGRFDDLAPYVTNSEVQRETGEPLAPIMSVTEYRRRLEEEGASPDRLWNEIRRMAAITVLAGRETMMAAARIENLPQVHRLQLLGLDVLIDERFNPWLLEINRSPAINLCWDDPAERDIKVEILRDALALSGMLAGSVPPKDPRGRIEHVERHRGRFEWLLPAADAARLDGCWYPRADDLALFDALGFAEPRRPQIRVPDPSAFVADGAIVFLPYRQRFLTLNEAASEIAFGSGAERYPAAVADDVRSGIWWRSRQLIRRPWRLKQRFQKSDRPGATEIRCLVGSRRFQMTFHPPKLADAARPVLSHMEWGEGDIDDQIRVVRRSRSIVIRHRLGSTRIWNVRMLPAVLIAIMLRTAYRVSGTLIALHGGAVVRHGGAVIVPGEPGRGKTTLIAALTASGFSLLSDEAAILDRRFHVAAAPTPLALTAGALNLLEPFAPGCSRIAPHLRRDGTNVHYLMPDNVARNEAPAVAVIFPRHGAGQTTELVPLGPRAAFEELHRGGFDLPNRLEEAEAAAIVDGLRRIERFELKIGSLEEAAELVSSRFCLPIPRPTAR